MKTNRSIIMAAIIILTLSAVYFWGIKYIPNYYFTFVKSTKGPNTIPYNAELLFRFMNNLFYAASLIFLSIIYSIVRITTKIIEVSKKEAN